MFDKFYVAAASGVESVVKKELIRMRYTPGSAEYGLVPVKGGAECAAELNMRLRTAGRVYFTISEGVAETFDELYELVAGIPFKDFLPRDARVTVDARSHKSKLFALSAVQSVTKRAVAANMGGSMSETGERYRFLVSIDDDNAKILLDTSGEPLHKRGYRMYVGAAPLAETLAAAMLILAGYNGGVLIDPFSGSGTIPIEAALIATNTAPGLNRSFSFERYPLFSSANAEKVRERLSSEIVDVTPDICGYDIDPEAVRLAIKHLAAAGLKGKVHFQCRDVKELSSRFSSGHVVTNPPYGVRLGNERELFKLYKTFGTALKAMPGFTAGILTAYPFAEKAMGIAADKRRKLYNASLECNFLLKRGAKARY